MDIKTLKLNLIQKLMTIDKPSLLKKINALVDEEMVVGYTVDGDPLTQEEYNKRLQIAEEQLLSGKYTSQNDLEDEAENW